MKNERKKTIKQLLKVALVLIITSTLLWKCEKQQSFEKHEPIFNYKQAPLKNFDKVIPAIEIIERDKLLNKSKTASLLIDKNNVLEISNNHGASYTFELIEKTKECNNCFQNLVVSFPKDQKPIARLFTYYPDQKYLSERMTNSHVTYSGQWSMEVVDFNDSYQAKATSDPDCNRVAVVLCTQDYLHVANGSCYQGNNLYTLWVKVCEGGGGPTDFPIEAPDNIGNAGNTFGGNSNSLPTSPLDDVNSKADLLLELAAKLGVDISLFNNLSESTLNKLNEIAGLKENLSMVINAPNFDALNDSWLKALREYAKKIEYIRTSISKTIGNILIADLNLKTKISLNITALQFTPNVAQLTEAQKQEFFNLDAEKGIGILLYEFANGKGPDVREFSNGAFWNEYFAGDRINEIKTNFETKLISRGLTFNQFVTNNKMIEGNNPFSPDHTSAIESFQAHKKANWVQFFVGGVRIEYRPTNQQGYIDVKIINPTSRNSLLLHVGESYPRWKYGSISLSSIKQHFYIRIKVR